MLRMLMLLFLAATCAACQNADHGDEALASSDERARPEYVTPKIAYEEACADCHESGKDGAPRTGDPEAWAGRSALWEAVLFEHVEKGYFDMPAHGTDGRFTDDEVALAAQYMLELTHPDQPRD